MIQVLNDPMPATPAHPAQSFSVCITPSHLFLLCSVATATQALYGGDKIHNQESEFSFHKYLLSVKCLALC
jgi:hypothetical protein